MIAVLTARKTDESAYIDILSFLYFTVSEFAKGSTNKNPVQIYLEIETQFLSQTIYFPPSEIHLHDRDQWCCDDYQMNGIKTLNRRLRVQSD